MITDIETYKARKARKALREIGVPGMYMTIDDKDDDTQMELMEFLQLDLKDGDEVLQIYPEFRYMLIVTKKGAMFKVAKGLDGRFWQ